MDEQTPVKEPDVADSVDADRDVTFIAVAVPIPRIEMSLLTMESMAPMGALIASLIVRLSMDAVVDVNVVIVPSVAMRLFWTPRSVMLGC